MPYNAFGTFSPQALEPYPIETELARQATGGSQGAALGMLGSFEAQRQANENLYTGQLAQQRALAVQALQQQMQDRQLSAITQAVKDPGLFDYMTKTPEFQGMIGSSSPDARAALIDTLARNNQATLAKTMGEAQNQAAQGGVSYGTSGVTGITGLPTAAVTPTSIASSEARSAGNQPRSAFAVPVSLDPAQWGRDPATEKAWTTNVRITGDPTVDAQNQELAKRTLIEQANIFKNRGTPFKPSGTTSTNVPPAGQTSATPSKDANPLLDPDMTERTANLTPGELTTAQRDPGKSGTLAGGGTQTQSSGGGAQTAPAKPPAQPPTNVRPANMPDTNPGDTEAWKSPAGNANIRRARVALGSLPPQVRDLITTTYARTGQIPLAVKDNVLHFVGPDGSDLGVVP